MHLDHHFADVNGTRLHYVRAGSGPLVILLHGFPQAWFIWQPQMEALASDHTVVAVDLRGFGESAKPERPWDYGTWLLTEDVRALVDRLGFETFTLVGHDTGGAVGYSFALHHPARLERLVVLSTAHPALFDRELRVNPDQIAASQYLLGLRRPDAVEALRAGELAPLRAILDEHDFFTAEDVAAHVETWSRPRAVEGMLGWYRAEGLGPAEDGTPVRGNFVPEVAPLTIATPSLLIHAERDAYVLPACFEGVEALMPDATVREVPGATHWLLNEHPQLITEQLRAFVGTPG